MATKLLKMVEKNFRLFARSRSSSLVIFLGPLLIVLLVGAAFTNTQFLVNVGVFSSKYTNLTDSVISKLHTSQFKVLKMDSEQDCINSVKSGTTQICSIFPPNFEIKEGRTNEIVFYVDFSKINLVYMMLDAISGKIGERAKEISTSLTGDILDRVKFAQQTLTAKKSDVGIVRSDIQSTDETLGVSGEALSSLDLSINKNDFKLNDLAGKINTVKTSLTDSILTIQDLQNNVADSNLSSGEKDTWSSDLQTAKTELQDALANIQGNNASAAITLVESARTALDALDARLKTASDKTSKAAQDIATIRQNLESDMTKLDDVLTSMDDIIKRLSNLQISNATQIVSPITTTIKPVTVERNFFSLAFPTLLVLFMMVTGILLSSTMVIVEKKSVAYFRNAITPTTDIIFNLASYLTGMVTMLVQVLIFLVIASLVFKINILSVIPVTLAILVLVITFFVFMGMLIGFIFKSEETGTLASITMSSIFLFFSSVVLPLETLPPVVKSIADYNPFVIAETMLKQALLFNFGFKALGTELLIVLGYVLVLFFLLMLLQKLSKSHFLWHREKNKLEQAKK